MQKVWLITGCSTGFGRELAKFVLANGHKVGVSARRLSDIKDILDEYPATSLGLTLDVTDDHQIATAIQGILSAFGKIDVLVNNAGIGYFGALEESEEEEVRRMFEINFWGLAKVTKAVLPAMRAQRSGHVVNFTSIGGLVAFPALGFYNATKFAVDGYSEALAKEVAHLGIHVTIVAPSGFRTDWAGRSANEAKVVLDDYAPSAGANRQNIRAYSGKQPGDPKRAAAAVWKIVASDKPPLRLLLGAAAVKNARMKLDVLRADIDAWEAESAAADFPPEER